MNEIEQVKAISILDVGRALGFEWKAGGSNPCYRGHGTKSPCLSISEGKRLFHCHSCGAKGSNIDLVKDYFNTSEGWAINWLKNQFGIKGDAIQVSDYKIVATGQKTGNEIDTRKDGTAYSDLYRDFLELCEVEPAIQYITGRGIPRDIAEASGIRVMPKYLKLDRLIEKYGGQTLQDAGLTAISARTDKPYNTFFNTRLIIPFYIRNDKQSIVFNSGNEYLIANLQGRNIDGCSGKCDGKCKCPKYRFLPNIKTTIYNSIDIDKSEAGTREICVTEGVFDCLSCIAIGHNAIAMGGAANRAIFEPEIFDKLGRLNVTLVLDNNKAGIECTEKFISAYVPKYHAKPKRLNWDSDKLKGFTDINEAIQAGAIPVPERYHSQLFNEVFTFTDEGGILFKGGAYYNPDELEKVKSFDRSKKQNIHLLKSKFEGVII